MRQTLAVILVSALVVILILVFTKDKPSTESFSYGNPYYGIQYGGQYNYMTTPNIYGTCYKGGLYG